MIILSFPTLVLGGADSELVQLAKTEEMAEVALSQQSSPEQNQNSLREDPDYNPLEDSSADLGNYWLSKAI